MQIIQELRNFSLLKNVSEEELLALSERIRQEQFKAGEKIIAEGENGRSMYLLIEGSVEILKTTAFGDEFVCAALDDTSHAVFGEMALIDSDKRSATVKARTNCKTLSIDTEAFKDFCNTYPRAGVELLFIISRNLVRNIRRENENLQLVYQALVDEIELN